METPNHGGSRSFPNFPPTFIVNEPVFSRHLYCATLSLYYL